MSYEEVKSTIGGRIKEARTKAGYKTQDELANALFCDRTSVSEWETNKRLPSIENILKMRDLFNCDVGYLLCEYKCETREITDIQEVTGLSDKTIERLMMYRKYKKAFDFFDYCGNVETPEYEQLKKEYKTIKNMIDNHFSAVRKNTNILKIINILFENEERFSVLENISLYLLSEFSLSTAEKDLIFQNIESDRHKDYLENYIPVYNKVIGERQDIKYSDISDTYLLKLQAQLLNLKDSILKEREPNK